MSELLVLSLGANEDIKQSIVAFLKKHRIEKAFICGAVGSARDLLFVAPEAMTIPPNLRKTRVEGPVEIVSFTGEAMDVSEMEDKLKALYKNLEGDCFLHLHASVAHAGGSVIGGGFWEGKSFMLLNIYMIPQKYFD